MRAWILAFSLLCLGACSAPRTVLWDGTVAEPGHVRLEADKVLSLPSISIGSCFDVLDEASDKLDGEALERGDLVKIEKAAVASSLEKPGVGINLTAAVGLGLGLEAGVRYISGNTGGDLRWQFLAGAPGDWNGGVGLSYTRNAFELSKAADQALGMEFKRQDLVLPLAFGVQEGSGHGFHANLACGAALAWTRVEYAFSPTVGVEEDGTVRRAEVVPSTVRDFLSYGVHGLLQPGWRRIHLTVGGAVWYTDYGRYRLPEGGSVALSGLTFQPALGLALKF